MDSVGHQEQVQAFVKRHSSKKVIVLSDDANEKYYTSADLFDSVVVKPSEGRTASVMFSYKF